ncbi:hypothetical protein BaRGS_00013018 [Batillaria attramentaria]|uniref:Abasic site processing protein HMCES n=1 Tax=Batillaria attramentaria TaxID=370345 RepID=A0ABD0L951_9CAEN
MCGRTACTLAPDDVVRACRFQNRQGRSQRPVWKDAPGGQQYYPSHNIAPASHTPVLLSSKHYPGELDSISERVVQPMKWGLVPIWHKGDPYKLEYETNNCRAEGMLTKRTYKVPLEKGQRCVVLADGFFEWKRTKDAKQPYFIYFPHNPDDVKPQVKTEVDPQSHTEQKPERKPDPSEAKPELKPDPSEFKPELKTEIKPDPRDMDKMAVGQKISEEQTGEDEEWHGKPLLKMAGVFEVWHPPDGGPPLYSYSVITVDASPAMSWIHHRMPVSMTSCMENKHPKGPFLTTDEEVRDWLEFSEVPLSKAAKSIRPTETIQMHMVSSIVNNSRNKSPECVEPYNPKEVKKSASSNLMMSWLSKGKKSTSDDSPDAKKKKLN